MLVLVARALSLLIDRDVHAWGRPRIMRCAWLAPHGRRPRMHIENTGLRDGNYQRVIVLLNI